jgi:MFS-type transporter involved in bile tolerance (Atg22 family)
MPLWVRVVAIAAAVLFSIVAAQLFLGQPVDALSRPLPFFAYPLLAATMFGWAWAHYRAALGE